MRARALWSRPCRNRFTHPVEGGSANDYDYADGDPINGLDLTGLHSVRRRCGRISCTFYLSRDLTRRVASRLKGLPATASRILITGTICGIVGYYTKSVGTAPCAEALGLTSQATINAVNRAVTDGDCFYARVGGRLGYGSNDGRNCRDT